MREVDSDQDLVARVLAGDRQAFAALYSRHQAVIARRLRRVLRHLHDVEDVLQVTFVEAYKCLDRYEPDRPFVLWVQGIAFRQAANHLRRSRRWWWLRLAREDEDLDVASNEASSEEQAIERELLAYLYRSINKLPAKKRVAFTLHVLEGLGFTEIGDIVDESPQTIRARVHSARDAILKDFARAENLEGVKSFETADTGEVRVKRSVSGGTK